MMRRRGARILVTLAAALAAAVSPMVARAAAPAPDPVQLTVSGMTAVLSNGLYTVSFDKAGSARSLVIGGRQLIGRAKGFYSSVNGSLTFSPTELRVVTDTPDMADIAYVSPWGELHYVARS